MAGSALKAYSAPWITHHKHQKLNNLKDIGFGPLKLPRHYLSPRPILPWDDAAHLTRTSSTTIKKKEVYDAQLDLAIGLPSFLVFIGIPVKIRYFVSVNGSLSRIESIVPC